MNAIELLNQNFGRYLVPQTGDAVADAQAVLSGGHDMAKGGTKQRVASGWAIIKPEGATMQFKLAAREIKYAEKTRYEAFANLLDNWNGTPAILMEFDKKPTIYGGSRKVALLPSLLERCSRRLQMAPDQNSNQWQRRLQ